MRHLKAGKRLGVTTSHRKAMMRNLVTSLLEHGEIKTTVTKAKEMRKYFDKMIGLGKRNDLHAKRQALSFIKSKEAYNKLFEEYGPLYADRNGGYTRIFRIGHRLGDNAQMALIQMVDLEDKVKAEVKESKEKIEEIKEELQEEPAEAVEPSTDKTEVEKVKADAEEEAVETEETPADEAETEESEEKDEKK
ncbi:MAG: 50S ribosomal protein L17 [Proteobacteria bacterium]|nr:50S ribosomal protein L17 [Pseudomonadota bacterium]